MGHRLPLPVKVMLSYLVVVAVGAVPTFFYLRAALSTQLVTESALRLGERTLRLATRLAARPEASRTDELLQLAALTPERLTLISHTGEVLYDTYASRLPLASHASRPEVVQALSLQSEEVPGALTSVPRRPGMGMARRVSDTTGLDTLYVAVQLPGAPQAAQPILRMARRVSTLTDVTDETVTFLRNAQALAVSVALGLSLLSALVLLRPLERLRIMSDRLAQGDYSIDVDVDRRDEIGDVGRALLALATELRQRMATAGAAEALLVQLVDVLDTPVLVFHVNGDVVALNGAARRLLVMEGPRAGQRVRQIVDGVAFQRALRLAEEEGQPEPVVLSQPNGEEVAMRVFVLKRPGTSPLAVLLPPEPSSQSPVLPAFDRVTVRPLRALIEDVRNEVSPALESAGICVDVPRELPAVSLAEVEGRLALALGTTLTASIGAFGGREGNLTLDVELTDTRVGLALDAAPSGEAVARIRSLVEPLGGALSVVDGEAKLWLPRA
ncbi:MAG: HAMP domain-containing protein [Myxococcota bacterium]